MIRDDNQALPSLVGSNALIAFLESELKQLESVAGEEDEEARVLLQQLEQYTAVLQAMSHGQQSDQPIVMSEVQLAQQLDSLDLQLSQLEASLAAADAPTLELLGQSTSRWVQAGQATAAATDAGVSQSAGCTGVAASTASSCHASADQPTSTDGSPAEAGSPADTHQAALASTNRQDGHDSHDCSTSTGATQTGPSNSAPKQQ